MIELVTFAPDETTTEREIIEFSTIPSIIAPLATIELLTFALLPYLVGGVSWVTVYSGYPSLNNSLRLS